MMHKSFAVNKTDSVSECTVFPCETELIDDQVLLIERLPQIGPSREPWAYESIRVRTKRKTDRYLTIVLVVVACVLVFGFLPLCICMIRVKKRQSDYASVTTPILGNKNGADEPVKTENFF